MLISIGAIFGANLRYYIGQAFTRAFASALPLSTLVVNVTGSFVLGLFLVWTSERVIADPRWRFLVAVGFCGGYTTYSSYAYETFALFEQGAWVACILNILLTNVLCIAGTAAGALIARAL